MGRQIAQGSCFSCYTLAFTYVVENRLKLKDALDGSISAQFLLNCNYMTEGCGGGWAVFHGYFAEVGGLMPDSCGPGYEDSTEGSCDRFSSCEPVAKVTKTYLMKDITVDKIKQEILYNGAVQTSWSPPYYHNSYVSGLLEPSKKLMGEEVND